MHYLTELSTEALKCNFELANEHLKKVFSQYPHPIDMPGCPCCVGEAREILNEGDFLYYLRKAMSTWGGEMDFKHYIPQLFSIVFLEKKSGDTFITKHDEIFILMLKLKYIQNWTQDEIQVFSSWFSAYLQYKYIEDLKKLIGKSRAQIQDWLTDTTKELSCEFPFSIFVDDEFNEMSSFMNKESLEKFAELLDIWPQTETDLIVYASCLINYRIFGDGNYGIFKERASKWMSKNENLIDKLFWKTEEPRSQKLFSDALPPNFYPRPDIQSF